MKVSLISLLFVLSFILSVVKNIHGDRRKYKDYHVYCLQPRNAEQLATLKTFDGDKDILFLNPVHFVNKTIYMILPPNRADLAIKLRQLNLEIDLITSNAQKEMNGRIEAIAEPNRRDKNYLWTEYHELEDTYNWMYSLEKQFFGIVSLVLVGTSFEGRDILGIKISYNNRNKSAIFLEGGMHAREWISPAVTTYITYMLLTSSDHRIRSIAEKYDWYIVPHTNPDGYVYTHTVDRFWRKTRTDYGNGCFGADPNRNFDFHWKEVGASDEPCSDTYAGPKALSEKETFSLSNFINTLKGKLFLYISFHSYSQLLLYPYGHTDELPPNYKKIKRVYNESISAIKRLYGTRYSGGNVYDAIYPASGSTIDWAYGVVGANFSFCYELRPSRWNLWSGFILPSSQIIPTAEETLESLMAMITAAEVVS